MFIDFFHQLKAARIPVSLTEYLTLMAALEKRVTDTRVDHFYSLARATLVKDERHIDAFERVFAQVFRGLSDLGDTIEDLQTAIPEEWLRALVERTFTEAERRQIAERGGWDAIMKELRQRLAEQNKAHQGGTKWIGTGGTSPFGNSGYNPAGVRIGATERPAGRALKVWEQRHFKDFDPGAELGTRNIKIALRRLRRFAREGAQSELDLDETIRATAHQGYLDLQLRPERRNAVKVLMFFDVGGSMDWHVSAAEQLFSAARTEFKHLEFFYFHNCIYESVWRNNARRHAERTPTMEILNTYSPDYKVFIVGDAYMSPYEISVSGGSVEHNNPEAGAIWLQRIVTHYPRTAWLNPITQEAWDNAASISQIRAILANRMYPLTVQGIDQAISALMH